MCIRDRNVACSSEFFLNYETVKGINVASNYINPISKKDEEPILSLIHISQHRRRVLLIFLR